MLTVAQTAEKLGVTQRYIRWLIETRQITFYRIGPPTGRKKIRIPQTEIEALTETVPARRRAA